MFQEYKHVRQVPGEGYRRWFADGDVELILWYNPNRKLEGFQIVYDRRSGTRTVTWKYALLPDGKTKSVLISDGPYNPDRLQALMERCMEGMESALHDFILGRLGSHNG